MSFGELTPVFCQEVLPSDNFTIKSEHMIRMAPMLAPVMHRMSAYVHFFFVPNRIVWDGWEEFITGGEDGDSDIEYPYYNLNEIPNGSIFDYLGYNSIPNADVSRTFKASVIPIMAHNKIYNEFYRDQNLIDPIPDSCEDGLNTGTSVYGMRSPQRRAWRHDYFTSALPFAQKGQAISIPIGDTANLIFDSETGSTSSVWASSGQNVNPQSGLLTDNELGDYDQRRLLNDGSNPMQGSKIDVTAHTYVDLSSATANTINDLRRAFRLQEWLEKNARGGTRYVELLQVHFGVKSQDSRLQRPEYMGGSKANVIISEVLQTTQAIDENDTPQGNMSGHGISVGSSGRVSKFIPEHGFIIGLMSVMPEAAYQQGLQRQFTKFDRFDYYWQDFAHIGEQPILNREIFNSRSDDHNDEVFGYTPRYSEYRFIPSSVHGDFKDTLDFWHFGRIFADRPYLNKEFIECNPGKRIFAVQDVPSETPTPIRDLDTMYCHIFHDVIATRPIPKFGIPAF